jgi:Tfp pilus assembly protein PilO
MAQLKKTQPKTKFGSLGRIASAFVTRGAKAGVKRTALISGAVALLLGFFIFWQYLQPMNETAEGLRKENTALNKQIAIAQMVQQTRPAFIEEYRRAKDIYSDLRDLLPNDTSLGDVMAAIQDIARRDGVRITLFDASTPGVKSNAAGTTPPPTTEAPPPPADGSQAPAAPPPPPRTVLNERVIPAQLVGSHAAILNFIRDVASYQLIIDTRDVTITSLNKQENVNLKLVAFDAPPSSALPPDPPELRVAEDRTKTALLTPHAEGEAGK